MTLSADHLAQLVQGSGITEALVQTRGFFTATTPAQLQALGFKDYQRRVPALVFPVHDVHGKVVLHQIRPDTPRINKRKKPVKYDTPEGQQLVLDIAPEHQALLPQADRPTAGDRRPQEESQCGLSPGARPAAVHRGGHWHLRLGTPQTPLVGLAGDCSTAPQGHHCL
jgi:hypothetical protein